MKSRSCIAALTAVTVLTIPTALAAQEVATPANNAIPLLSNKGLMVGGSATSVPAPPTINGFGSGGFDGFVPFILHTFSWHNGDLELHRPFWQILRLS